MCTFSYYFWQKSFNSLIQQTLDSLKTILTYTSTDVEKKR